MQTTFNNITLHYKRIGPENSELPVLLFLHEALGSIDQWKEFPHALCETLRLPGIVYERQGHGNSSAFTNKREADYLHKYALEEIPAFLDSIQEKRPILLVGHSDGGTIALLFASKFPGRVLGVVTMAAHVINEPETKDGIAPAVQAFEKGKLDGLRKFHGKKTNALFYAWANIWRSDDFSNWDITKDISNATAPGLFIQGADDQYGTYRQLALISKAYSGNHRTEMLDSCGHHPHLEQKATVIQLITSWIKQNSIITI